MSVHSLQVPRLRDIIERSVVLCYREDVTALQRTLAQEGLNPSIYRPIYSGEELKLPSATRTFMSHRNAWQLAAKATGYTLICEADFIPCRGVGDFPVFWPENSPKAWGYLYQGSPRLLALKEGFLRGHCAPLVAYVVNKYTAEILLRFYDLEVSRRKETEYYTFDAHLQWYAMGEGAEAYIPAYHYGEHGGLPNPEHAKLGRLPRAGIHRADNLIGPLAFLPHYAKGSMWVFYTERLKARGLGFLRLLMGRWIKKTNVYTLSRRDLTRMFFVGLDRLVRRPTFPAVAVK
jgi:hypothetical protein